MTPKQRGLGRGLDALFEDEEISFAASVKASASPEALSDDGFSASDVSEAASSLPTGSRKILSIGQLTPNPDQPRTSFDPQALDELADSIREHGLLQPILVRPIPTKPDLYEIVAGERRWRASQKAQLHQIPVVIRDLDDGQVLQIALIENLQRQDLNAIEEATSYRRLIDEFAHSAETVAKAVGRSRSHVANMIRLLSLPQSVQTMVVNGVLSAGHARALINAQNPALLAQDVASSGLSVRETEKLAASDAGREVHKRSKGKGASSSGLTFKDPNILSLEKEVSNALGVGVTITMKAETEGDLSIHFKTLDQLDDILHRLSQRPVV